MRIIKGFLDESQIFWLRRMAGESNAWHPGRQGTGYEVLPLKKDIPSSLSFLVRSALGLIGEPHGEPHGEAWDVYLIRYPDGASIPKHLDDAAFGLRHRRINAMVTAPDEGGELVINGELVPLDVGDAVLFYPNEEEHEVSTVRGMRLLFSVGAWVAATE